MSQRRSPELGLSSTSVPHASPVSRPFLERPIALALIAVLGLALRVLYPADMEWKEDEQYNFFRTTQIGITEGWPWVGMNSGVFLANPGMSIWIFVLLARVAQATDPLTLSLALRVLSFLGVGLLLWIAYREVKTELERRAWVWAYALAMVNPILLIYTRKLWPEPFFTLLTPLLFIGWFRGRSLSGAFFYGLVGACLGQVHLSGFFLAFALFLWTLLFRRDQVNWKAWVLGSIAGAWPLLPWLLEVLRTPISEPIARGLPEMLQLKYWVFWATSPLGLHVGNSLGLLRGNSTWAQLSDFIRYPLLNSQFPTYLSLLGHGLCFVSGLVLLFFALRRTRPLLSLQTLRNPKICSPTEFLISSALLPCGILMTLTGAMIRRYYLTVVFPLDTLWLILGGLAALAGPSSARHKRLLPYLLPLLFLGSAIISGVMVHYTHVNQGAPQGDYGEAFHRLPFGPMKDFRLPQK
jgi:hypothetical protein